MPPIPRKLAIFCAIYKNQIHEINKSYNQRFAPSPINKTKKIEQTELAMSLMEVRFRDFLFML